jgi:hypothetical protein
MENYTEFTEMYGKGLFHKSIDVAEINEYDQFLLTPEIINLLAKEGISSYGNGFIWTLDPNEYVEWFNKWLDFEDRCVPFMRTAFGDIFFMRDQQPMVLNSNKGLVDYTTAQLDWFFNRYLAEEEFMEEYFNMPLYEKLNSPELSADECYGYRILLSDGGTETTENLSKVQLKEYLHLLSKSGELQFFQH